MATVRLEALSIEKSDDISNRTRDLPACSTIPQPTTIMLGTRDRQPETKPIYFSLSNIYHRSGQSCLEREVDNHCPISLISVKDV
jgi:hypothetical protein